MKKFLVAGIAAAAFCGAPALAADLPTKAPAYKAVPTPVISWTGCYLGANGGYGRVHKDWYFIGADEGSNTFRGGLVGGQIGCDYQTGNFVFGAQGMFDWASMDASHLYKDNTNYTDDSKVSALATLTGRIGYLVQPAALLYIKGGAAWVRDTFTDSCPVAYHPNCLFVAKVTRSGWTVGGGLEYLLQQNWSIFAEYNYMDFGRRDEALSNSVGLVYTPEIKQNVQTIQVGLNYRFGDLGNR
jgi:outer membrane immunogenic protein